MFLNLYLEPSLPLQYYAGYPFPHFSPLLSIQHCNAGIKRSLETKFDERNPPTKDNSSTISILVPKMKQSSSSHNESYESNSSVNKEKKSEVADVAVVSRGTEPVKSDLGLDNANLALRNNATESKDLGLSKPIPIYSATENTKFENPALSQEGAELKKQSREELNLNSSALSTKGATPINQCEDNALKNTGTSVDQEYFDCQQNFDEQDKNKKPLNAPITSASDDFSTVTEV